MSIRSSLFLVALSLAACAGANKDSSTTLASADDSGVPSTTGTTEDSDEPDIPDGTLDEVLPIMEAHCLECHGASAPAAGLDLESDFCGAVLDGRLVVPGSTGESLLYRRITSEEQPMPPAGLLETDTIRPIGVWILNGAVCE